MPAVEMEKNELEVTITRQPSRRVRFLRRAKAILWNGRQHQKHGPVEFDKELSSLNACSGPTILHNLLPIVDLLTIVNPKLSKYEDRILGRQRQNYPGAPFAVPTSFEALRKEVVAASESCDCDKCCPSKYQTARGKSHGGPRPRKRSPSVQIPFHQFRQLSSIPCRKLVLKPYGDHEAMYLVRKHVEWLNETYLHFSSEHWPVPVQQLKSILRVWSPNLIAADMRQGLSRQQLIDLFNLLNQIFFHGSVPGHRAALSTGFSWLPEAQKNCFGVGSYNYLLGTQILLHPTLYRGQGQYPLENPADLDLRWRNRLGTILHEMCHAFLKAYSCRACSSHDSCMGAKGHGRAWQILATKIEQVATKVLDGFIDLGRYPSLLSEIQASGRLPSQHDLQVYQFGERWESAPC